jgi:DNA replication protein DnaC
MSNSSVQELHAYFQELQLRFPREHYETLATQASEQHWTHVEYLARLLEGECHRRRENRIQRRIQAAHFPGIKTLESFNWTWPRKINRAQVQNLFRLAFLVEHANVIFLGGVGLGKTHLATALGHRACLESYPVLFTTAVDMINTLSAAQATQRLKIELRKYLSPSLLLLDEVGYLPIDKHGADLLFQVISARYEHGSIVLTTNKPFKQWATIFNNDSTLASAVLDRLLHHAETIVIEGSSYRMKERNPDEE